MANLNADDLDGTVFISDNLPFLKALDTESVDLVCIDPPFAKNETFTGNLRPPLSADERRIEREFMADWGVFDDDSAYRAGLEYPDQEGTTARFADIFRFDRDVHADWMQSVGERNPGLAALIESSRYIHSDSRAAYIAFMAERMLEIRRVLKASGSVYLHCDPSANAYLRQMMDAVFGFSRFRSEIVWRRTGSQGGARRWGPIHDTILFYSKSDDYKWNRVYQDYDRSYIDQFYRFEDDDGRRYQLVSLTSAGTTGGDSGREWRGVNPTDSGRHWAVPIDALTREFPDIDPDSLTSQEKLDLLDEAGLVYWPEQGEIPRQIRYLDESPGVQLQDMIMDIRLGSRARERTGYPTQKPQALARRIIEASSEPGDLVLDCFAGCAYVPVAAQLTGRRWIACDMSPRAWTMVRRQFHKHPDLGIVTEGEIAAEKDGLKISPRLETANLVIKVRGPHDLPTRTTPDEDMQPAMLSTLPPPRYRARPVETDREIWDAFVSEYGTTCWYCGAEKANDRRELQLDHVEPNARDGTNDDCWNRALACVACNGDKSNRLTPDEAIETALERGRIPTRARMQEVKEAFASRRRWANERWERIAPRRMV